MGVAGRIGHMVPIRFPAAPLCGVPVFVPSLRTAMIESGTVETGDESMKDLVEFIAKSLADKPEEVEVREVEGDQVRVLELRVAKEDLGKIIGKQGARPVPCVQLSVRRPPRRKRGFCLKSRNNCSW